MQRTALRALGLLLPLLVASAVRADDDPQRPAWLVGRWDMDARDGPEHLLFQPDGTAERGGTNAEGKSWSEPGGRWEVRDGSLVIGDASKGEETLALKIERPVDVGGQLRARLVAPGTEASAPVLRKALDRVPGRPPWLIGTWISPVATGEDRLILHADGMADVVEQRADGMHLVDPQHWKEQAGRLILNREPNPIEIILLSPAEGRLRARLLDGRPEARSEIWTRASWLPEKQTYLGPLLGRWDVAGAALPTAWFFGPYGRYEKRREFGGGTFVERGAFQVARGATGDVLQLDSDSGHRGALDLRIEGAHLRTIDPLGVDTMAAQRVEGSANLVAMDAIEEATTRADKDATRTFLHGRRRRIVEAPSDAPVPGPAPSGAPGDALAGDPAPGEVFLGMEAFAGSEWYRFESGQVLVRDLTSKRAILAAGNDVIAHAVPGSARPRVVTTLIFNSRGRVQESTQTGELNGIGDPVTVVQFGKYGLQGDVVLVQFDAGPEGRWRLGEAGRFLHRGEATFLATVDWHDQGLDGPK